MRHHPSVFPPLFDKNCFVYIASLIDIARLAHHPIPEAPTAESSVPESSSTRVGVHLGLGRRWFFGLAAIPLAQPFLSGFLAAYPAAALSAAYLTVYLLPGLALWRLAVKAPYWGLEALAGAFALSFSAQAAFSIVFAEFGIPLSILLWAWCGIAALLLAACGIHDRRTRPAVFTVGNAFLAITGLVLLAVVAVILYRIGGTYGSLSGEEGYHLVFIRKIFSATAPDPLRLNYLKGVSTTYIYLPYHFGIALIAKLAGLDPLAAYIKFRPVAGIIAIVATSALAARMALDHRAGWTTVIVLTIFILTNHIGHHSGYFAQFVPLSHHSDVMLGAGLAMGCFVLWRAAASDDCFGAEFWIAVVISISIFVSHAREGTQILLYAAVLAAILLAFKERKAAANMAGLVLLLLAVAAIYQHLQGARVDHLSGWEAAEKSQAFVQLKVHAANLLHGDPLALFRPRIDRSTSFMPNFDLFFMPLYLASAGMALIVLAVRRDIAALFLSTLIFGTMLAAIVPIVALAMVIVVYSQILFTPLRFVMHWEMAVLGLAVFMLATWGAGLIKHHQGAGWLPHGAAARGALIFGAFVLAGLAAPSVATRTAAMVKLYPWSAILFGCAVVGYYAVRLFREQRRGIAVQMTASAESAVDADPRHGAIITVLVLALLVPTFRWVNDPSLWRQYENAETRPSGLDVNAWIDKTGLLDIPGGARKILEGSKMTGAVVAYDPRYVFNLPVMYNVFIPSLAFYISTERDFFESYYKTRRRSPPLNPKITSMYKYVDAFMSDLMLRFPLYNWIDPLDVTLEDIRVNGIQYVLASPEFLHLWRTYRVYFPDLFVAEYDADDFAVYRMDRERLAGAIEAVKARRAAWVERDISEGFLARAAETLRFSTGVMDGNIERRLSERLLARMPEGVRQYLAGRGDAAEQVRRLMNTAVLMPAQKHYDIHIPPDLLVSSAERAGAGPPLLPIFLPKATEYELIVAGKGLAEGTIAPQSEGVPLALKERKEIDGVVRYRFRLDRQGFQMLTLGLAPAAADRRITDVRLIENLDWAAISVTLPKN